MGAEAGRLRREALRLAERVALKRAEVAALTEKCAAQAARRERARADLEQRFAEKCAEAGLPDYAELEAALLALQREEADLRALQRRDARAVASELAEARQLERLSKDHAAEEGRLAAIAERLARGDAAPALFEEEIAELEGRRQRADEEEEQLDQRIAELDGARAEELGFAWIGGEKPEKARFRAALGAARAEERILREWADDLGRQLRAERRVPAVPAGLVKRKEEELAEAREALDARMFVPRRRKRVTYREAIEEKHRIAYELKRERETSRKGAKDVPEGSLAVERARKKSTETIARVTKKAADLRAVERSCQEKWEEIRELGEEAVARVQETKREFAKLAPLQERNRKTAELLASIDVDRDPAAPIPPVDQLLAGLNDLIATVLLGTPEDMRFEDRRQKREYEELAERCRRGLMDYSEVREVDDTD